MAIRLGEKSNFEGHHIFRVSANCVVSHDMVSAPQWQIIQFLTDNMALVSIINSQSSRSKRIMSLLRELVLLLMQFNITFKAKHIPGIDNSVADAISRRQWEKFRQLAPFAKKDPEPIPATLSNEVSRLLRAALSSNTSAAYSTGVIAFENFRAKTNVPITWPPPIDHIVDFIAYLSINGYAESTARS